MNADLLPAPFVFRPAVLEIAAGEKDQREVEVRIADVGRIFDGVAEEALGFVELTELAQGFAEVVEGFAVSGMGSQDAAVFRGRFVGVPLLGEGGGEGAPGFGGIIPKA